MIKDLLVELIALSDEMRAGYKNSLGAARQDWKQILTAVTPAVPEIFQEIYSRWAGTHRDIAQQQYMDFIPGCRLIHIEEFEAEYHALAQVLESDDTCEAPFESALPLLADDASSYIFYAKTPKGEEGIFHISPEEGLIEMHRSAEQFLQTIVAFYKNGVYFLDDDGFLDYDFEKEGIVGAEYNPGIDYWPE